MPPMMRVGFTSQDIDNTLADFRATLDINRNDLNSLMRQVEQRALSRSQGEIKCSDIMSKDVVCVDMHAEPGHISNLLRQHDLRTLPVVSGDGKLAGIVGYSELYKGAADGQLLPSKAVTAHTDDAAISLLPALTDGSAHTVVIVDDQAHIMGIVSQTDLLIALSKTLLWRKSQ